MSNVIPTYEEVMRQMKIHFNFLGIPFNGSISLLKLSILLVVVVLATVEELAFFYSRIAPENLLELTQLFPCTATLILSVLKIFTFVFKRQKIYILTERLETLYNKIKTEPTKMKHVTGNVVFTKMLVNYYIFLNIILVLTYNFSSVVIMLYDFALQKEVRLLLPYFVIVPFQIETWFNWAVVYTELIFAGFFAVLFFVTVDSMYFIMTTQVCINFKALSFDLEKYKDDDEDGQLNEIIKRHQHIIQLSEDLEDIFTGPNFFNILISSLSICALGFNLTTCVVLNHSRYFYKHSNNRASMYLKEKLDEGVIQRHMENTPPICVSVTGDWAKIPGAILFLASVLIQLLMMSVFGENLSYESGRVGNASYLCNWYNMNQKTKKTILIIQERAKRTQKLTAFKFSVISYGSFTSIIRASWSYFTILRTVNKPSEALK